MAPTLCSPSKVRGQRSEVRVYGAAAFPETSFQSCNTPMDDPLSLGPSGLLWETSSKDRGAQSEDLQK